MAAGRPWVSNSPSWPSSRPGAGRSRPGSPRSRRPPMTEWPRSSAARRAGYQRVERCQGSKAYRRAPVHSPCASVRYVARLSGCFRTRSRYSRSIPSRKSKTVYIGLTIRHHHHASSRYSLRRGEWSHTRTDRAGPPVVRRLAAVDCLLEVVLSRTIPRCLVTDSTEYSTPPARSATSLARSRVGAKTSRSVSGRGECWLGVLTHSQFLEVSAHPHLASARFFSTSRSLVMAAATSTFSAAAAVST